MLGPGLIGRVHGRPVETYTYTREDRIYYKRDGDTGAQRGLNSPQRGFFSHQHASVYPGLFGDRLNKKNKRARISPTSQWSNQTAKINVRMDF